MDFQGVDMQKKSRKFTEIPGEFVVLNMAGAYGFLSGKAHSVTDH